VIGLVLAAGAGRRLAPLTDDLPKTLLPVDGARTILDIALSNLRHVGVEDVVIVVGFARGRIEERLATLQRRYGVRLHLVVNERAEVWNNAYSLWAARDALAEDVLLLNGDTVHPPVVEERVLAARGDAVLLAVDDRKPLAEEEMKVILGEDGGLRRITKAMDPAAAAGEYIGVTYLPAVAGPALVAALEATWRRDPQLYYEDGYQELVDRGGRVAVVPIGAVDWVEVDDHRDLARAREVACRY
jgi:choline kinase